MVENREIVLVVRTPSCDASALVRVLRDGPRGLPVPVMVNEEGHIEHSPPGLILPLSLLNLLETWKRTPDEYDSSIRVAALEKFPLSGAIVPVTPADLSKPVVRNALVHCIDAARICGDKFCLVLRKGMGYGHSALDAAAGGDDHLHHSLRQVGLEFEFAEDQFQAVLDALKAFVETRAQRRAAVRRQARAETVSRAIVTTSVLVNHIALVCALAAAATFALYRRDPPPWMPWRSFVSVYAALLGVFAAAVPTRASFAFLERNSALRRQKRLRYLSPIMLHGAFLLFLASQGYATPIQLPALAAGFLWELLNQSYRANVFLGRIRLQSITAAYRTPTPAPQNAVRRRRSTLGLGSLDERERWDALARRQGVCARNFMLPRPFVFISYAWDPNDRRVAERLKRLLDQQGVEAFLDRDRLSRGSMWRAVIAENIYRSTHFLFLASSRSIRGLTCSDEVRFVLELMGFSTHPTISICALEEPSEEAFSDGDPVFQYLWERAEKVSPEHLLTPSGAAEWVASNMPSCWVADLRARRSCSR